MNFIKKFPLYLYFCKLKFSWSNWDKIIYAVNIISIYMQMFNISKQNNNFRYYCFIFNKTSTYKSVKYYILY